MKLDELHLSNVVLCGAALASAWGCADEGRIPTDEIVLDDRSPVVDAGPAAPPDAGYADAGYADAGYADAGHAGDGGASELTLAYDFAVGDGGWDYGFSDYTPQMGDGMDLAGGWTPAAETPDALGAGFLLQGTNRSDDLFMYLEKHLGQNDGIEPGQTYVLSYDVTFWSDAQSNCAGIGGAPGESVFLKVGASGIEPEARVEQDAAVPSYRMNIDKGNQATGGQHASVAGHIANGQECAPSEAEYRSVTRSHTHDEPITASADGLWLIIGTDSGFEGETALYYERVEVHLEPEATR